MKKILFTLAALTMTSAAFAATNDAADKASDTTSTSKNPLTGSVTTTHKMKRKVQDGKNLAQVDVTEKTTTKKSGEVDQKVKVDGSSTEK